MKTLILSLILSGAADAGTTCAGLRAGLVEGQPGAGWVKSCPAAVGLGAAGTLSKWYIVNRLEKAGHRKWAKVAGWTFVVTSSGAAIRNTITIGRK